MNKRINGKTYDTKTAKVLGVDEYSSPSDLAWYCDTLYRTIRGNYFLHGEGGPQTRYAKSLGGNSWSGGETIIPLTEEEAKKWVEKHLSADQYTEIFDDENDDDYKRLNTYLSAAFKKMLAMESSKTGISMSLLIEQALADKYGAQYEELLSDN